MNELPPDLEALIFDAAAGDLSPEDAERLRAAIDADPSVARLVDDQRSTAADLTSPAMSEMERARLHRSVAAAVIPERQVARVPWQRWAFAVAAVVVVVAAGGFALLGGGLGQPFDDMGAEIATAPVADTDTAGGGDDAFDAGADSEESARTEGESATGPAPAAGEDAASDAADGSAPEFPACAGLGILESAGVAEFDQDPLTARGWSSPEEVAAALVDDGWVIAAGEPRVEVTGDIAVITWTDDGVIAQQVEAVRTDLWVLSRRVTCSP